MLLEILYHQTFGILETMDEILYRILGPCLRSIQLNFERFLGVCRYARNILQDSVSGQDSVTKLLSQ